VPDSVNTCRYRCHCESVVTFHIITLWFD